MEAEEHSRVDAVLLAIEQDGPVDEDTAEPMTAVLTKVAFVAEWMDVDGNRWLTRRILNGNRDAGTHWDAHGLFFEALYGDWDEEE